MIYCNMILNSKEDSDSIHTTQTMDVRCRPLSPEGGNHLNGRAKWMCVAVIVQAVSTGSLCYHYAVQEEIVG